MSERGGVTLKKAAEMIGGDKPLSTRTISAMITRGDLEAYGDRKGRRVTLRSINGYLDGGRRLWRDDVSETGESVVAATFRRFRVVGQRRIIQSPTAATSSSDAIQPRKPRNGWQS